MFRVEKPSVNEWLTCPDVSLFYEAFAVVQAHQAWRSGQASAKETHAAIEAEVAHLRRK